MFDSPPDSQTRELRENTVVFADSAILLAATAEDDVVYTTTGPTGFAYCFNFLLAFVPRFKKLLFELPIDGKF